MTDWARRIDARYRFQRGYRSAQGRRVAGWHIYFCDDFIGWKPTKDEARQFVLAHKQERLSGL